MSKFHSTVSRRDFIKVLGFGAGLGTAMAATPVFHDLDELTNIARTNPLNKWWVKENDYEELTTPVDWNIFQAVGYQGRANTVSVKSEVSAKYNEDTRALYQYGIDNKVPGLSLRDMALSFGARGCSPSVPWDGPALTLGNIGNNSTFPGKVTYSPWQGNTEDNLKMCRAALHYYGSPRVGVIEVNEHTKRLFNWGKVIWDSSSVGNIDKSGVQHVPESCRWILVYVVKQEAMQNLFGTGEMEAGGVLNDYAGVTNPNKISNKSLGGASSSRAYAEGPAIQYRIMRFIKALGYQAYDPTATANVPFGVFSGLAEESRSGQSLSPDYGIFLRYMRIVVTDLPLIPTKPINAGLTEFCKVCKRCAEVCPSGGITQADDTSWEGTGPWPVNGGNNRIGFKGWFLNWQTCADMGNPWNCTQCQSACPFNSLTDASVHSIIRATAAITPVFNSFFATMERNFGYGKMRSADEWWDRDLASWKHDSLFGFGTAGW
ncbi:reductive dehalogenase [Dehalococcoides mccartyi]|uniref:Reductive dehalogenase n=1 Tax=Dehalococcoides mccartyi (strain VS) TaxID=311424 RepID=D2BJE3_DEHMV|nr:reductive dehalogenase [Dehalococcoides mccartyi]ACZ62443.1 reductive dehalogenase [Dehalococcoides mccartyi VS]